MASAAAKTTNKTVASAASASDLGTGTSTPSSSSDGEQKQQKRISLASLRTTTMFEQRDASHINRNKPPHEWTVPRSRSGRAPRAATLFLGKDVERWQQHERERMDASGSAGLRVAWRAGASSTIQVSSSLGFGSDTELDDDGDDSGTTFSSDIDYDDDDDDEDEDALSTNDGSSFGGGADKLHSRRTSSNRRSSSRNSRSQNSKSFPRVIQTHSKRRESIADSLSSPTGSMLSGEGSLTLSSGGGSIRRRRFSSNGPEAALLRHETVIGIHTPRRDSFSSAASVGSNFERIALAPLSQINAPPSGNQSSVAPSPRRNGRGTSPINRGGSPNRKRSIKTVSSSDVLAQAAEAAAAAASKERKKERSISSVHSDDEDDAGAHRIHVQHETPTLGPVRHRQASTSPQRAFKLAPRRKPIRVDGTLYDRSGPFREGAVTDGLCVRFFSTEDANEANSSNKSHDRKSSKKTASRGHSSTEALENAVADEEMLPTTYLITTPDNRVSSAAKLRRWAMDGAGNFYAAMEIKSIEAKMRAADPTVAGPNGLSKGLLRELRERYLDDLLDEVQKTETLNPGRSAVAHVLCTSDNKYLRLEEDYPEEAFFVIAGCDEHELEPVVSLVFAHALRAITDFHAAGWLHGDIKLENLMFDEQGRLVVIDYENANPFRGIPGGDGRVTLVSYDWIPPEAFPGPHGRRAGPSADLWALGCNVVRAFALRDNVEDADIRETLLGKGQQAFLNFRRSRLLRRRSDANGKPTRRGSDVGVPGSSTRPLPTSADVDLSCLLQQEGQVFEIPSEEDGVFHGQTEGNGWHGNQSLPPPPGPTPQRLLRRFAEEAPELLKLVLARCISDLPEERSVEAEIECLHFAETLEREQGEKGDASRLSIGQRAVKTAIDLSGSSWVRPKLEEARQNLGLGSTMPSPPT